MKRVVTALITALCSLTVVTALAQPAPPSPEEQAQGAVERRQAVFKLIVYNFGPVAGMMRKRVPFNAAVVEKNSGRIEVLAGMIAELFGPDTRKFKLETAALDGIWDNKDDFASKANDLMKAANALAKTAAGGDQAATLKAAGALGKACGNCHDNYREKDD